MLDFSKLRDFSYSEVHYRKMQENKYEIVFVVVRKMQNRRWVIHLLDTGHHSMLPAPLRIGYLKN